MILFQYLHCSKLKDYKSKYIKLSKSLNEHHQSDECYMCMRSDLRITLTSQSYKCNNNLTLFR